MNAVSGQKGSLLHINDSRTNEKWLVDGGALLSIIPPTPQQRNSGPNGTQLKAANGTKIDCFGTITKTITIGERSFTFEFIIANVSQRILGADFLAAFYLAPNHRDGVLLDLNTFDTLPATLAHGVKSDPINLVDYGDDPYYKLLDSFPDVITPSFTPVEPKHGVRHYIPTTGRPVQSRARRLDPQKLATAKAEMDKLCKLGVARRGKSEWASPLLVVPKPDGSARVCGDYRRLNNQTTDDKYPVRALQDFNVDLHGKKIFSKIDLLKGYHQIPVADEDVGKTAVITPFGLFVFPRTPFGLKNAGQDFQRLMDAILGDIPRVFVYIDDILVASETPEQHLEDLACVFKILAENGLVVNRDKCILGKESLDFLGYRVDANGIAPLEDRVSAIQEMKPPKTIKDLQSYLGVLNYYRRFIKHAAHHLYPLYNCLKGKPKSLQWTTECQKAFEDSKAALAAATLLHHPIPGAPLALTTDASKRALAGPSNNADQVAGNLLLSTAKSYSLTRQDGPRTIGNSSPHFKASAISSTWSRDKTSPFTPTIRVSSLQCQKNPILKRHGRSTSWHAFRNSRRISATSKERLTLWPTRSPALRSMMQKQQRQTRSQVRATKLQGTARQIIGQRHQPHRRSSRKHSKILEMSSTPLVNSASTSRRWRGTNHSTKTTFD